MEQASVKNHNSTSSSIGHQQRQNKERLELSTRDTFRVPSSPLPPDFILQWGNKKRLRCMKIQTKEEPFGSNLCPTVRVDCHVVSGQVQQCPSSFLRSSETMKGSSQGHSNNGATELVKLQHTPDGKKVVPTTSNNSLHRNGIDSLEGLKKVGGGSSSGSEMIPSVAWPPTKFVIALTNEEKEEDFMAIKGSKLPLRPRKRSKYVQSNVKLVSPGACLCELSLNRYEVRENITSKKRPRGLKAMCNGVETESELLKM